MQVVNDWKALESARQTAAEALAATHPHLQRVGAAGDGLVTAAKNIRTELARKFPGVRFSVKTSRFSMGDSIRVRWTDGPNVAQVEAITQRYEAGSFNGEDDSYTYRRNAWRDAFGDAKYLHCDRSDSPRAVASALRTVAAKWGPLPDGATAEAFERGELHYALPGRSPAHSLQCLVRRELTRRTWHAGRREVTA